MGRKSSKLFREFDPEDRQASQRKAACTRFDPRGSKLGFNIGTGRYSNGFIGPTGTIFVNGFAHLTEKSFKLSYDFDTEHRQASQRKAPYTRVDPRGSRDYESIPKKRFLSTTTTATTLPVHQASRTRPAWPFINHECVIDHESMQCEESSNGEASP